MHILVIEDDPKLSDFLVRVLHDEGHTTAVADTGAAALERAPLAAFDVILLDWMLPDANGPDVARRLRASGLTTPVLMLTARGESSDKVTGLRAGADDYLTKPFDVDELLARVAALARRGRIGAALDVGPLSLDRLTRRATLDGAPLDLTAKEFALLSRLALAGNDAVPRATILLDVWQLKFDPGSGVLDVHVSRLRDKLGAMAWMVETVRGVGYRLRAERP
ncbi:MAG: response regulator transcription factor [Myxococcales bacterium]|nr:response regulator transcription factor [Myxococcales bacterium]MBL0194512.1 response regulator transcription factor [Myxococcales bacterium]HQY61283.1 response regulator transcription factor [Polyangiaceae bacterium]